MKTQNKNKAFTLIELLVVIIIFLAVIAVPVIFVVAHSHVSVTHTQPTYQIGDPVKLVNFGVTGVVDKVFLDGTYGIVYKGNDGTLNTIALTEAQLSH